MRSMILAMTLIGGCGTESAETDSVPVQPEAPVGTAEPEAPAAPPPDAAAFCATLEREGLATRCTRVAPQAISARARLRYDLDLASVEGEPDAFDGAVMSFDDAEDFDAVEHAYEELAAIAGPHRYGNRDALIFVQLNQATPLEVGDRVRAMVESL